MTTAVPERVRAAQPLSETPTLPLLLTSDPVMDGVSHLYAGSGLTRIAPGTYVSSQEWKAARPELRHLTLIRAVLAKTRGDVVLLGPSAAVWLGLPLVGRIPRRVQCLRLGEARSHTAMVQRRRRPGLGGLIENVGVHTASVADTVVDVARWGGLTQGVCAMDAALGRRLCTHAELADAVDRLPAGARGIRSARTAAHLADERAESPGESVSRVRMWQATLPRPDLQHEVRIDGELYRLDFFWPQAMLDGEFDGHVKYTRNSFGKDTERTVWEERQRELALIRAGYDVARWLWKDARPHDATAMHHELARHNIHPTGTRW
ncbi:hypothetical protein [Actinomyces sp. ZJ308]|uniref:hypothetical protein n=1 Tax=Actinomyces sp. ZJ308 TaxID=2708342 RepID=UPI001FBA9213|nr:hypothetical protein [Actinomyces sp. ZJ308]